MSKEILVSIDEYENRVAVMEDKKLCEIYISREDRKIGSIYKGKVTNVLPGMQAAFINIGLEKNAFLCVDDILTKDRIDDEDDDFKKALLSIKDIIKVNQDMLVQVIKESIGGKGPRVTAQITLPGRYFVYLPMVQYLGVSRKISDEAERERLKEIARKIRKHKEGLILRTAAEYKEQKELEDDYESLVKLWKKIFYSSKKMKSPILVHQELTLVYKVVRDIFTKEYDKMIIDSSAEYEKILELLDIFAPDLKNRVHLYQEKLPLFQAYEVEKDIEKALKKKVWLDSGGYLIIERTEALTVIDVNSGKYVGKDSLAQTILKINIESAKEIAHQLRLRDLGGIIIIDFIDMDNNEDKKKVLDLLEQELKKDRVKVFLVGITELGLVQLTRKRMRKDLSSYLSIDCPQCKGEGKIFSIESIKIRFEREIKKLAVENKIDSILASVNPKIAMAILGWEGEDLERLEKQIGKIIYLRVEESFTMEKVEIECLNEAQVRLKIETLWPGQKITVKVLDSFNYNIQNGMAIHKGNIIEIINAGDRIGTDVEIIVTFISRSYNQAQLRD